MGATSCSPNYNISTSQNHIHYILSFTRDSQSQAATLRFAKRFYVMISVQRQSGFLEMASVRDVAEYILTKLGSMSTWKLQKLVYYSQAWHLVWEERELFSSKIEAWANGPVCPDLYAAHKGSFSITTVGGNASGLSKDEVSTVDATISFYNKYTGQQLSDLTHREAPWLDARQGMSASERGTVEITTEKLAEYYGSL